MHSSVGTDLTNWHVKNSKQSIIPGSLWPKFALLLTQSQRQNNYEWKVNSLDVVLGLVGVLAAVVWLAFS